MKVNFRNMPRSRLYTYKNIIYASVLEVRYVKMFETLGIEFQYERHTVKYFWQNRMRPYLPDFFLPQSKLWLEVKGNYPTKQEIVKAEWLARRTQQRVVICSGVPSIDCISLLIHPDYHGIVYFLGGGKETVRFNLREYELVPTIIAKGSSFESPDKLLEAYKVGRDFDPDST